MATTAVSVLDRAKANLVYRHPFFAAILMRRPLTPDPTIPTACVDQRGLIRYNPTWVETLSLEEAIFLLCHEVMHVVWQHVPRMVIGRRDQQRWNIATDAVINDLLKAEGIGKLIPGGVDMPGSKDKTPDEIYNSLPQQTPQSGPGSGQGGIGGDLDGQTGGPMSEEEASTQEAETKVMVAQAAQAAKMQGKLPGSIAGIVADMIESKVPWYDVLERYMVSYSNSMTSWARPNRRFEAYLPSTAKLPTMGKVVIQIDVSGSISQEELSYYNGHLQRIIELCRPSGVHVLYVDTHVQKHVEFGPDDEVKLEFYSGGGTHMLAGFDYVEREGLEAEVIVCLTDGYTGFDTAPALPVVWVCSTDVEIPYGTVVRFTRED